MVLAELILFVSLSLCVYVYFGYPVMLVVLGELRRREVRRSDITPTVALIVPAYNEERVIGEKLENSLALDYPKERLEIVVVSDGSTDDTEEIVGGYEGRGVRLLPLARVGKAEALNQAVAACQGEILVFSDANAVLATDALRHLVANFHDRTVGGVCGNLMYQSRADDGSAGRGESLYWTYDKWIKSLESRLGSTVAAGGSIYAIRRQLYVPIAHPAQADDFAISARVVTQGYRLIFEEGAVSHEDSLSSSEREFRRRVRVTNHSVRGILYLAEALNPWRHGFYAIELLSHKVLRYLVPFCLLVAFLFLFFAHLVPLFEATSLAPGSPT